MDQSLQLPYNWEQRPAPQLPIKHMGDTKEKEGSVYFLSTTSEAGKKYKLFEEGGDTGRIFPYHPHASTE